MPENPITGDVSQKELQLARQISPRLLNIQIKLQHLQSHSAAVTTAHWAITAPPHLPSGILEQTLNEAARGLEAELSGDDPDWTSVLRALRDEHLNPSGDNSSPPPLVTTAVSTASQATTPATAASNANSTSPKTNSNVAEPNPLETEKSRNKRTTPPKPAPVAIDHAAEAETSLNELDQFLERHEIPQHRTLLMATEAMMRRSNGNTQACLKRLQMTLMASNNIRKSIGDLLEQNATRDMRRALSSVIHQANHLIEQGKTDQSKQDKAAEPTNKAGKHATELLSTLSDHARELAQLPVNRTITVEESMAQLQSTEKEAIKVLRELTQAGILRFLADRTYQRVELEA